MQPLLDNWETCIEVLACVLIVHVSCVVCNLFLWHEINVYISRVFKMTNASYSWDPTAPEATLKDIDAKIPRGSLVAVVGRVGSGKSTFLSAILGDVDRVDKGGNVTCMANGVAYVSQQPWIQNRYLAGL